MGTVEQISTDVCVVGAGIVGLAHALEARERGLEVTVLERSPRAVGASVRNFGHVAVSAMAAGRPLQAALRARERWLELDRRGALTVQSCGTVIVARGDDELAVLEAIAAEPERRARMLTPAEVGALAPIPTGELRGGLHATLDLRVDPRSAVAGVAALLTRDPGVTLRFGASVHAVAEGEVHAAGVRVRAGHVVLCPGPDFDGLPAPLSPRRAGLSRCKLQMLRVSAPAGRRYAPALLTGLSLLHYPGYGQRPEAEALRARVAEQSPEIIAAGMHLIVTQLPGGDLVLGDTHEYGLAVCPFGDEALDELVLAHARRLLGAERLSVRERWHGIYPTAPGDPFCIEYPLPGVSVVEVVSGIGMTTALGLAALTFGEVGDAVAAV